MANKTTVTRRLRTLQIFLYLVVGFSLFFSHPQPTHGMEFVVGQVDLPTNYPLTTEMKIIKRPKPLAYNPYNCVSYVNWRSGGKVVKGIGTAKNHPINSLIPAEGAIVVLDYKPLGHLAYVEKVNAETITISECNALYPNGPCGSRDINKNDTLIKGYYYG